MLGVAIAVVVGWLGISAIRSTPPVPADPPDDRSEDLGIFEPVAGRIVYSGDFGLWAVDPSAPSPSTLVQLSPEGGFPIGWTSDGTDAGTKLLMEARQSITSNLLPVGNELYFGTQTGLWKTDGTPEGTQSIGTTGRVGVLELTMAGGTVFFSASGELWRSDGTRNGTIRLKDIFPGSSNWSDPR